MVNVFTDGGSRGNPGPSALGVFITDELGNVLWKHGQTLGIATNNVAEYRAVIAALTWLANNKKQIKGQKVAFFMDSLLICSQIRGLYKVKNSVFRQFMLTIREKEAEIGVPIHYTHIPREKNKDADAMVNMALDKKL